MAVNRTGGAGITVDEAFALCFQEMRRGALPMAVEPRAIGKIHRMLLKRFTELIGEGHWESDGLEVLRQAWHVGAIAHLMASSGGKGTVDAKTAMKALEVVRYECPLGGDRKALGSAGIRRIWCTP